MKTRILVVEDEQHIGQMIEAALGLAGYECEICRDGRRAVAKVHQENYDLILLDIMLPEMNGFEVIEAIKSREIPVIFLTALQDVTDKVKGLRLGAEDYIVKPFEIMELLARIEVVLRRYKKNLEILEYRDIRIYPDRHLVEKAGRQVALTPKEFDLFVFFVRNKDIAIGRERLLSAVWGYEFMGESRTVDIHVQQKQKKLDLSKQLVTIPKLGYRLES